MRKIDGEVRTIRELLSGARYSIDYYQREYRWQAKQVAELMDDLISRFQEEYEPSHPREAAEGYGHYFLGSIISSHKNSQNYIIDGQQRLTTLTLLLIHLHNLQKDRDDAVHDIEKMIFSQKYGRKSFNIDVEERLAVMEAIFEGEPFDDTESPESIQNILAQYEEIKDALTHQKQLRDLERRRNSKRRELFDAQDAIDQQREDLIGKIEKQLKHTSSVQPLFTLRWAIR